MKPRPSLPALLPAKHRLYRERLGGHTGLVVILGSRNHARPGLDRGVEAVGAAELVRDGAAAAMTVLCPERCKNNAGVGMEAGQVFP